MSKKTPPPRQEPLISLDDFCASLPAASAALLTGYLRGRYDDVAANAARPRSKWVEVLDDATHHPVIPD